MGGEPFVRDDWHFIAKRLEDYRVGWSIITNGQQIKDKIPLLLKLKPYTVGISLDGATPKIHDYIRGKKGAFKTVIESISLLKKNKIPVSIITSVNKLNLNELKGIRELIKGKKIAWQIQNCIPIGRFPPKFMLSKEEYYAVALFIASTLNDFNKFKIYVSGAHDYGYFSRYLTNVQISQWKGCQAGLSVIGVQSNGNVKGCLSLPDEFIEGNIRNESIIYIWNNPDKFRLNRGFNPSQINYNTVCSKCIKFKECKGGCFGFSHSMTGKFHNHPYCLLKYELKHFKKAPILGNLRLKSSFSKLQSEYMKFKFFISQSIRT